MSVYTVHEPPPRAVGALAQPERFAFVRDGFYWWAFLLPPFWMLRHRLWLVLFVYVVVSAAIDGALRLTGTSALVISLVGILISLLIGFEAGTLRRFTFNRRRWRNVGVVSGDTLEDAERRFFDTWVRKASVHTAPPAAVVPAPLAPRPASSSAAPGVIGLFPEPGAQR